MSEYTRVADILDTASLPNPTTPVPFEKFAPLNNSNDMIDRAAFWAFYAAWLHEKQDTEPRSLSREIAVRARQDAHTFKHVARQLHIRDCILMRQDDVNELLDQLSYYQSGISRVGIWCMAMVFGFFIGIIVMLVLRL